MRAFRSGRILAALTDVCRVLPVVTALVQSADGRLWPRAMVPAAFQGMLDDYRLVQYDLLLGAHFALGAGGTSRFGTPQGAAVAPSSGDGAKGSAPVAGFRASLGEALRCPR